MELPLPLWRDFNTLFHYEVKPLMSVAIKIREYLKSEPAFKGYIPSDFGDDFNLIKSGALDSIGIFMLVNFLEKQFSITVGTGDLVDTNFKSIKNIEHFVLSRKNESVV